MYSSSLLRTLKSLPVDNQVIFYSIAVFVFFSLFFLVYFPLALWIILNKSAIVMIQPQLSSYIFIYYLSCIVLSLFISSIVFLTKAAKNKLSVIKKIPLVILLFYAMNKFNIVNFDKLGDKDIMLFLLSPHTVKIIQLTVLLMIVLIHVVIGVAYKCFDRKSTC